jgi:hypothetical protein
MVKKNGRSAMFNTTYNAISKMYVMAYDYRQNVDTWIAKLERGDADSSGSTLRAAGIIALVLTIFALLNAAISTAAVNVASTIGRPSFR